MVLSGAMFLRKSLTWARCGLLLSSQLVFFGDTCGLRARDGFSFCGVM